MKGKLGSYCRLQQQKLAPKKRYLGLNKSLEQAHKQHIISFLTLFAMNKTQNSRNLYRTFQGISCGNIKPLVHMEFSRF